MNKNYKWNLFTGGGAANLTVEKIVKPLDGKIITPREYFKLVTEMIIEYGKPEQGKDINEYLYDPVPENEPAWFDLKFETITEMLKHIQGTTTFQRWGLVRKRHYIYMIRGVAFEYEIAKLNPKFEKTTDHMDYYGGIDFIDRENKTLYSVKSTSSIDEGHLKMIEKYFDNESNMIEWHDYNVKIIWNNAKTGKNIILLIGKITERGLDTPNVFD